MLNCKLCLKTFESVKNYINHIRGSHKFLEFYECAFESCSNIFNTINSLNKHLHKHTSLYLRSSIKNVDARSVNSCKINSSDINEQSITDDAIAHFDDTRTTYVEGSGSVMSFLLKFYNHPDITRKHIQDVVDHTYDLISDVQHQLYLDIKSFLSLDEENCTILRRLLSRNPFEDLRSEYNRFKFLETSQHFITPYSVELGQMFDDRKRNYFVSLESVTYFSQVIDIRKVLKKYLELPNVLFSILKYIDQECQNSNTYSSVFNSDLWSNLKLQFENKIFLPILLYFDDFECNNPLGSHSGVHKLGGIYLTIAGIPPKYSSQLENIFLWSLFHSSDRSQFGNISVLTPILEQLHELENNGLQIEVNENKQIIYFTLFLVLGDNLGVNSLTGFVESFSGNYFCRICYASKQESQNLCIQNSALLRNQFNYRQHCSERSHGIKEFCKLNDLKYFHIVENICCDIMHDILEGICRYDMAKILYNFIYTKKYFSLEHLNNRIKYFDYDQNIDHGNRIPVMLDTHIKNGSITVSASEMLALVVYFPFLVHDFIDIEDDVWYFYLKLYEILELCYKSEISLTELNYLHLIIKEHNESYMKLFSVRLKPKYHILTHYPSIIKKVGPLRYLSSIRFESFHKIGKTNAHVVTSRKNITYTLALRYQLRLCYRFYEGKGFLDSVVEGKANRSPIIPLNSVAILGKCYEIEWFKFNGTYYRKGCFIRISHEHNIVFGKIIQIFRTFQEIYIHFEMHKAEILPYMKAVEIDEKRCYFDLVNFKNVANQKPLNSHRAIGNKCVLGVFDVS